MTIIYSNDWGSSFYSGMWMERVIEWRNDQIEESIIRRVGASLLGSSSLCVLSLAAIVEGSVRSIFTLFSTCLSLLKCEERKSSLRNFSQGLFYAFSGISYAVQFFAFNRRVEGNSFSRTSSLLSHTLVKCSFPRNTPLHTPQQSCLSAVSSTPLVTREEALSKLRGLIKEKEEVLEEKEKCFPSKEESLDQEDLEAISEELSRIKEGLSLIHEELQKSSTAIEDIVRNPFDKRLELLVMHEGILGLKEILLECEEILFSAGHDADIVPYNQRVSQLNREIIPVRDMIDSSIKDSLAQLREQIFNTLGMEHLLDDPHLRCKLILWSPRLDRRREYQPLTDPSVQRRLPLGGTE